MRFKIFVNDRSKDLYSCLADIEAESLETAVDIAKKNNPPFRRRYGLETYKAIEWPVTSDWSKRWLAKHVSDGF